MNGPIAFRARIVRNGNSLEVRIPSAVVREAGIMLGDPVDVTLRPAADGRIWTEEDMGGLLGRLDPETRAKVERAMEDERGPLEVRGSLREPRRGRPQARGHPGEASGS